METQEKRLYTFSHMLLSDTAKGIQNLHSVVELFNKYIPNPSNDDCVSVNEDRNKDANSILWDWSINHKTCIALNGRFSNDLILLEDFLKDGLNYLPWASFKEDQETLEGILTSISIIMPEKIYKTASDLRGKVISISCGEVQVLDWEDYNESFNLQEYHDIQEKYNSYGKFSEFELELINRLMNYRLV